MGLTILIWFAIGAGIAAGAFAIARTVIQLAVVGYAVLEKRLDARVATRQSILLTIGMVLALLATAIIAGYAILTIFGLMLQNSQQPTG